MLINYVSQQSILGYDSRIVYTPFDSLLTWLNNQRAVCLDTEGTGLDPHSSDVLSIQIGTREKKFVIDATHPEIKRLAPYLESQELLKIGVNIGYDYKMLLSNYGIRMEKLYDCSRADEVIFNGLFSDLHSNPDKAKGMYLKAFSMAGLAKRHLGIEVSKK